MQFCFLGVGEILLLQDGQPLSMMEGIVDLSKWHLRAYEIAIIDTDPRQFDLQ